MTDVLYGLVSVHGAWIVFAITFAACVALPIPASLAMLAAGAFVASGDLWAATVLLAALGGAVLGDQTGYAVGRVGGPWVLQRLARHARLAGWIVRAEERLAARPGPTVFMSRWVVAALGPYVNLAAGAAGVGWVPFTVPALLGKAVWVGLYVGLGYAFAAHLEAVGASISSALAAMAAALVALWLGRMLWRKRRA